MADPLSQLRQFHINGREIKEYNDYIIFGDHGWPKNVNTNYQVYSTEDDKSKKEYYTLDCLLYFLRNMDVAHTHYVKQAGHDQKTVVRRPDRKDLLAYLKGESQIAVNIDKNAPIPAVRLPVSEIYKKGQQSSADTQTGSSSQSSSGHSQSDPKRADASHSAKKRLPQDEDITKVREEFRARLFEPSNKKLATVIPTENAEEKNESSAAIRSLGAEKLAALRAKHLAIKRTTIQDAEPEPGTGPVDPSGREDLLFAMDAEKFSLIKSKEKVWRTRSSILQAPSKNFAKSVLPMIDLLEKSSDSSRKSISQQPPPPADLSMNPYHQPPPPQQPQPAVQKNSYNRYDQERFVKLDIGVEIDTKKSFVGGVSNGLPGYNKSSPTKSTQATPTRAVVSTPNNGTPGVPKPHDTVDNRSRLNVPTSRPMKRASTVPIIIIPATTTSLINMYNAAALLQDLTYVDGKASGRQRENEILIQRRKTDGSTAMYKIMDNPLKLDPEDWNRVVAVFVQGPAWQFKGWPWGGSPVEIFSRIKGFHLKWDETKLDDNVSKWNVHILELSRTRRHLDKANLLKFWSSLDTYMMKYKSFLRF